MTIKQITRFINILIYNNIIIVKHANMNVIKSQKKPYQTSQEQLIVA